MNDQYVAYITELINGASINIASSNARLEEIEKLQEDSHSSRLQDEAIELEQQMVGFTAELEMGQKLLAKYEQLHPWKNRDDLLLDLAEQLALDIQMEIDDGDIPMNVTVEDWLEDNNIASRLEEATVIYFNKK